jgi:F-type H+-transporting ATPase subunit epsilon
MPAIDTDAPHTMHLQVLLPTEVLVDQAVSKIIATAENGEFCLLPKHIDFVAALAPGVMSFWPDSDTENYAAIDVGILVKCGHAVFVSTPSGVRGTHLGELQQLVEQRFLALDTQQRNARSALSRLESAALHRFANMQDKFNV